MFSRAGYLLPHSNARIMLRIHSVGPHQVQVVATFTFKQLHKHILLITEQLAMDAWVEIVIRHLWQASFPETAIFWSLGHLAAGSVLCLKASIWLNPRLC